MALTESIFSENTFEDMSPMNDSDINKQIKKAA